MGSDVGSRVGSNLVKSPPLRVHGFTVRLRVPREGAAPRAPLPPSRAGLSWLVTLRYKVTPLYAPSDARCGIRSVTAPNRLSPAVPPVCRAHAPADLAARDVRGAHNELAAPPACPHHPSRHVHEVPRAGGGSGVPAPRRGAGALYMVPTASRTQHITQTLCYFRTITCRCIIRRGRLSRRC